MTVTVNHPIDTNRGKEMLKVEVWVKKIGSIESCYYTEEKYINLIFFGGLFRWNKFHIWKVYNHDFIDR